MRGWLPGARQDDADIVENRGDRGVRLVNGDLDGADAGKRRQDGVGDGAGFTQIRIADDDPLDARDPNCGR